MSHGIREGGRAAYIANSDSLSTVHAFTHTHTHTHISSWRGACEHNENESSKASWRASFALALHLHPLLLFLLPSSLVSISLCPSACSSRHALTSTLLTSPAASKACQQLESMSAASKACHFSRSGRRRAGVYFALLVEKYKY